MNRWKCATIILALCIVALLIGGPYWIRKDRERTRVATLKSLYAHLTQPLPRPSSGAIDEPIILDLTYENNELRYTINGRTMDLAKLRQFINDAVNVIDDGLPMYVRPTAATPLSKIVATLRFLAENRVKWFSVSLDEKEWVVLTDRNFSKVDAVELLNAPEQMPGDKN